MLEAELQSLVFGACRALHLLAYHTHDSRRSQAGFPDLVIVGSKGALFRELKKADGRVSPEQQMWIDALNAVGNDAAVWRPEDWPLRIMRELQPLGALAAMTPVPSQDQLRAYVQKRVTKSRT